MKGHAVGGRRRRSTASFGGQAGASGGSSASNGEETTDSATTTTQLTEGEDADAPEQGGTEAPAVSAHEEDIGDDDGAEVETVTSGSPDPSPGTDAVSQGGMNSPPLVRAAPPRFGLAHSFAPPSPRDQTVG